METSVKTFSILSNIYIDQLIHLLVLSHTSTFEQSTSIRKFRCFLSILLQNYCCSLSHTNGSFIVWLILCTMRLMSINKHQLPTLKIIFIITIRMMLIWKNYSFDKCGTFIFWSISLFLLFKISKYRNNVFLDLILGLSSQSNWTSIKWIPV